MDILVACEESQAVCKAFRAKGHNAFSCDLVDCSGGHNEWHIKQDVLPLLDGFCEFTTCDGQEHKLNKRWDMIIAFPPCTYLTVAGNRWFNVEKYGEKAIQRHKDREAAVKFFMAFVNADCDKIIIENPIGVMSTRYRKPNQVIQPWMFGHGETKATCFWLKGVPNLEPTNIVEGREQRVWKMAPGPDRAKLRSKTYQGVAQAMVDQWGTEEEEYLYNIFELAEAK